jgi:hypothetical protein
MMPFPDIVTTFHIQGQYILEAFQNSIQFNQGWGRFLQVSGLRIAYNPDPTLPLNLRVLELDIYQDQAWTRLDLGQMYKVVTVDFLRVGGDGFSMLSEHALNSLDGNLTLSDVVANYLAVHSPIAYPTQEQLDACNGIALPIGKFVYFYYSGLPVGRWVIGLLSSLCVGDMNGGLQFLLSFVPSFIHSFTHPQFVITFLLENQDCRIVQSPMQIDFTNVCLSDATWCYDQPRPLRETILGLSSLVSVSSRECV